MEPLKLTGSVSPNGNLEALVEQDDRCAYLYLREREGGPVPLGLGLRSCWVRNLKPAPPTLPVAEMRGGLAPRMPAASCAHPAGAPPLSPERLRLVWLEEGDAVALLEDDDVLALMPCWSGQEGFQGYARDCTEESPLAWPLPADGVLLERVRAADACWRSWRDASPWPAVRDAGVAAITAALGTPSSFHAIDAKRWPPAALLRCVRGDAITLVTCGMQLRPQPTVEMYTGEPRLVRRVELALAMDRGLERAPADLMAWLAVQARYPWDRLTWLGHHHTLPCPALPRGPSGRAFSRVLLLRDPPGAPAVAFPPFRGDPVTLLWLVPVTDEEAVLAQRAGGGELARRLAAAGHGAVHRDRASVA